MGVRYMLACLIVFSSTRLPPAMVGVLIGLAAPLLWQLYYQVNYCMENPSNTSGPNPHSILDDIRLLQQKLDSGVIRNVTVYYANSGVVNGATLTRPGDIATEPKLRDMPTNDIVVVILAVYKTDISVVYVASYTDGVPTNLCYKFEMYAIAENFFPTTGNYISYEMCKGNCSSKGYPFTGIYARQCLCDTHWPPENKRVDLKSECDQPCPGNPNGCGGATFQLSTKGNVTVAYNPPVDLGKPGNHTFFFLAYEQNAVNMSNRFPGLSASNRRGVVSNLTVAASNAVAGAYFTFVTK